MSTQPVSVNLNITQYKNILFLCFLLIWFGPMSITLVLVVSSVLYSPSETLPRIRSIAKQTYEECMTLIKTLNVEAQLADATVSETNRGWSSLTRNIRNRFYDTI
jgi:hypothetical protein